MLPGQGSVRGDRSVGGSYVKYRVGDVWLSQPILAGGAGPCWIGTDCGLGVLSGIWADRAGAACNKNCSLVAAITNFLAAVSPLRSSGTSKETKVSHFCCGHPTPIMSAISSRGGCSRPGDIDPTPSERWHRDVSEPPLAPFGAVHSAFESQLL